MISRHALSSDNEILSALPDADREWILSRAVREEAPIKRMFLKPGEPPDNVYFVESGLASMVIRMSDSSAVEVGVIGKDGLVGLQVFLGGELGRVEVFQQVAGAVTILSVEDFRTVLARSAELRNAMSALTLESLRQMTMAIACNRLHPVEQRLARWLLMVRDKVESDTFSLTQLFLAEMLGVRRPGVSISAGMLQSAGLINYSRGKIHIRDPIQLEAAACECYGALRRGKKSR